MGALTQVVSMTETAGAAKEGLVALPKLRATLQARCTGKISPVSQNEEKKVA